ncbi:MAG: hypothetical protein KY468_17170 [Armatimonadetes bacterium]|nr:hypothetical protein [Armatimonadota bacterium]
MVTLLPPVISVLLMIVLFAILWQVGSAPFYRRTQREEAERKAEELLQSQLSPDEYHQLITQGYLRVQSPAVPNRTYLIPRFRGLVRMYEQGRQVKRLCVGPVDQVPDADVVLMHKLMIEGNEEEYLETANVF